MLFLTGGWINLITSSTKIIELFKCLYFLINKAFNWAMVISQLQYLEIASRSPENLNKIIFKNISFLDGKLFKMTRAIISDLEFVYLVIALRIPKNSTTKIKILVNCLYFLIDKAFNMAEGPRLKGTRI